MNFGKGKRDALASEVRQRDMLVAYKKTFGGVQREVLFDLLNRYHFLSTKELTAFENGQRSVVADILTRCNISIRELDQLLKGDMV